MRESIREQRYASRAMPGTPGLRHELEVYTWLEVDSTRAGDPGVWLCTTSIGDGADPAGPPQQRVLLDAEQCERLGIDLQIRASYLRGVRPPAGPEPDPIAGPDDVPLIPEESPHGR